MESWDFGKRWANDEVAIGQCVLRPTGVTTRRPAWQQSLSLACHPPHEAETEVISLSAALQSREQLRGVVQDDFTDERKEGFFILFSYTTRGYQPSSPKTNHTISVMTLKSRLICRGQLSSQLFIYHSWILATQILDQYAMHLAGPLFK
ncbi:uncharacterized protein CLUP02_02463 [Colletotrichum lupini]|uniref:Uncharacterized protein n=1 Tax=Colletotrichum lupini TaxID=145971 RepID=A0A9Q8SIA5_9PEZI|nr:uncharacterized protein CLUP02_02463 [Colletotrichum lupini]UQC76997.1 hypothetical protein CLUP02_02463 [Colletotrichum lupini]